MAQRLKCPRPISGYLGSSSDSVSTSSSVPKHPLGGSWRQFKDLGSCHPYGRLTWSFHPAQPGCCKHLGSGSEPLNRTQFSLSLSFSNKLFLNGIINQCLLNFSLNRFSKFNRLFKCWKYPPKLYLLAPSQEKLPCNIKTLNVNLGRQAIVQDAAQ